ncbi:alpha/beta-hydrolase [Rickenella mellea]|uniref:Alpha/beta-hydrolase n=1 Tax=Rickenella mellea TaxID=50990 RepID=A0A4Y7QL54_9AGAM|nr:alpha/beta-hydrolase [Rickenella mellea]
MSSYAYSTTQATSSSSRSTRKKSSLLSLRSNRKESVSISSPVLESSTAVPTASQNTPKSPQNPPTSYFDRYPRRSGSNGERAKARDPSPASVPKTAPRKGEDKMDNRHQHHAAHSPHSLVFPSVNLKDAPTVSLDHKHRPRTRSKTNTTAPGHLRFSGSSSHTQYETPPQTPIEYSSALNPLDQIRVVVAAPIAGVETMDALVDGMNSFDDDDLYKRLGHGSKTTKIGHHPLYHPPLPTPPPGITLGGGKPRPQPSSSSQSDDEEDQPPSTPRNKRRTQRSSSPRTPSSSPSTPHGPSPPYAEDFSANSSIEDIIRKHVTVAPPKAKVVVPSISEIIRKNAPPRSQIRTRPPPAPPSTSSHGHMTVFEESEPEPEPLTAKEAEMFSRSSIDSIAEEVQKTLKNSAPPPQPRSSPALPLRRAPSFPNIESQAGSSRSRTPLSDRRPDSSAHSSSSHKPPLSPMASPDPNISFGSRQSKGSAKETQKEAIATYLRSTRLTTLLKLTRLPHATRDEPLTVSLADLGSPTGFPLVVFLGLGCVRYVMGLYDEMAECLGLRIIAIDRWGLGRTSTPRSTTGRGIPEWASIVDEVLDTLHIDKCSIMAHSAGAPYALSFASKYPERIVGEVCLLAPWVGGGEGAGYRWLKYVPNGLLKTAQAAEWKVQAWMLGKPPTITYEGIGYDLKAPVSSSSQTGTVRRKQPIRAQSEPLGSDDGNNLSVYPSAPFRRPSFSSGTLSDYDDLRDFDGRFESRTTLGAGGRPRVNSTTSGTHFQSGPVGTPVSKRKPSRGFFRMLKGSSSTRRASEDNQPKQLPPGKKLKHLKSMGSLRNGATKSSSAPSTVSARVKESPVLPEPVGGFDAGFGDLSWDKEVLSMSTPAISQERSRMSMQSTSPALQYIQYDGLPRAGGRRSVSFTTSTTAASFLSSPSMSTFEGRSTYAGRSVGSSHGHGGGPYSANASTSGHGVTGMSFQTALGNALIAASHAESNKGTHSDLLQILNHEQRPWGFSYSSYPHAVRVWYGDKDERIAENAVRWMERSMGEGRCTVKVIHGADHALLYKSSVVVDVLEHVREFWRDGDDD